MGPVGCERSQWCWIRRAPRCTLVRGERGALVGLTNALMLVVMCLGSGPAGSRAPVRGVRQAAVDAADAEATHGAAAPAAAALGALHALPQGVPHAQLAQQPQEHLPSAPARAAARPARIARAAPAARNARAAAPEPLHRARLQDRRPAPQYRLLQIQRSV